VGGQASADRSRLITQLVIIALHEARTLDGCTLSGVAEDQAIAVERRVHRRQQPRGIAQVGGRMPGIGLDQDRVFRHAISLDQRLAHLFRLDEAGRAWVRPAATDDDEGRFALRKAVRRQTQMIFAEGAERHVAHFRADAGDDQRGVAITAPVERSCPLHGGRIGTAGQRVEVDRVGAVAGVEQGQRIVDAGVQRLRRSLARRARQPVGGLQPAAALQRIDRPRAVDLGIGRHIAQTIGPHDPVDALDFSPGLCRHAVIRRGQARQRWRGARHGIDLRRGPDQGLRDAALVPVTRDPPGFPGFEQRGDRWLGHDPANAGRIAAERIQQRKQALRKPLDHDVASRPGMCRGSRERNRSRRDEHCRHSCHASRHYQDLLMTKRKFRPKIGRP
jgi:hypothetical protein